ncbi:MAG: MotA/TolQ/ExbB proton channel family protein [Bacteriodetes bacterium]|nr:MotA/TolQ/ExbB proton channel family protein [Bacteroidota bacterium]
MKSNTVIGILLGAICIFGAFVLEGGGFASLFMIPPIVIVLGGTLAATLAGTSFSMFLRIPKLMWISFKSPKSDIVHIIDQLVEFNALVRREGYLVLRDKIYNVEHNFFRKMLRLSMDGMTMETISKIATSEMNYTTARHQEHIALFKKMAGYSPTMGIIGTVIGLITTLSSVTSNPAELIQHIATAFIATLWGIFMANIVWLPIAERLHTLHNEEMKLMTLVLDGVTSMHAGVTSTVIRAELVGVLPSNQQDAVLTKPLPRVKIAPIHTTDVM